MQTMIFGKESLDLKLKSITSTNKVNRNGVALMPLGAVSGVGGSSIITFQLPQNTIVDLTTLSWLFDIQTLNGATGSVCRLPNSMCGSIVERIDLVCGGATLSSFSGYNNLHHIKNILSPINDFKSRSILNHEQITTTVGQLATDTATEAVMVNEVYSLNPSFCMKKFYSLLGESSVSLIDTGLIPPFLIKITLASSAILSNSANTTNLAGFTTTGANAALNYQISNTYMTVDCLQLIDPSEYQSWLSDIFNQDDGCIKINFKNYYTTISTVTSTRMSISSQSIDNIYFTARSTDDAGVNYMKQGGIIPVKLPVKELAIANGNSYADLFVKAVSRYFKFSNQGITNYQLKINGNLVPQYQPNLIQMYANLLKSNHGTSLVQSFAQFCDTHFVSVTKLNGSDCVNEITGIDSRNTQSLIELTVQGLQANSELFVVVESTATLNIFPGQQIRLDL